MIRHQCAGSERKALVGIVQSQEIVFEELESQDSLTFSIIAIESLTHCFDSDEIRPTDAQFVDEDSVCAFFTLSAGVCDSPIADQRKLELIGDFQSYGCLATGAGVDQKAKRAAVIDHDHYVWLATDDLHV